LQLFRLLQNLIEDKRMKLTSFRNFSQGLVNRHEPLLYILTTSNDVMWLNFLLAPVRMILRPKFFSFTNLRLFVSLGRMALRYQYHHNSNTFSTNFDLSHCISWSRSL
jgi:hypothetical protein